MTPTIVTIPASNLNSFLRSLIGYEVTKENAYDYGVVFDGNDYPFSMSICGMAPDGEIMVNIKYYPISCDDADKD